MGETLRVGVLAAVCLLAACSSKHNTTADNGDTPTSKDAGGGGTLVDPGSGEGGTFGAGMDSGPPQNSECDAATQFVYVISQDNILYSFAPTTLTFAPIGMLNCAQGGAQSKSMGVDRNGIAWVLLSDGTVNKVDVKTGMCMGTSYSPGQGGFMTFGMGFSTAGPGSSSETLYVSDHDGKGLAKIDTSSLTLSAIAPYSGDLKGITSELTGTGDGKLYGFFITNPARIAEIDKTSGAISNEVTLMNTYAGTAWAFSFYAGDFYVYTADDSGSGLPKNGTGSDVTKYSPKDGSVTVVKPKIGFTIVGAGESTCVPTTGPK